MKRHQVIYTLTLLLASLSPAYGAEPDSPTEPWTITNGGQLYDNWAAVMMKGLPETTHPSYPAAGKKKGSATWRCKECHGWDYRGKDGAYGSGSHFTGIPGIRQMVGAPVSEIKKIIRDKTHQYDDAMISNIALDNLAAFVSLGQLDMVQYIDDKTKKVRGDAKRGARYYQTICAICHGFDGKQINFKPAKPDSPEYIGTVANENPWETLHKIRNGQPGIPMVAMGVLDVQDQIDILAYTQTLPMK